MQNYGSLDSLAPAKLIVDKDLKTVDSSLLFEIDHTVKKYADSLLLAIESVSARLSQVETRNRQIETSLDDLKLSVDTNHGSTDGKLKLVESIFRAVQDGVQVIKNKQDIMDTQLQLARFQVPKLEQEVDTHNTTHVDSAQPRSSAPVLSHQQFPPVLALAQPPFTLPPPNAPPSPPQQNSLSQVQLQNQLAQNPISSGTQNETYFPPIGRAPGNSSQQYQLLAPQQPQTSIPPHPHQGYQPSPSPPYSQPSPPLQGHPPYTSVNHSQPQPPLSRHPEERHHIASQNYPLPNTSKPPSNPASGAPASQQFYAAHSNMFEPPYGRQVSGFSGPSTGPGESYPYSGSPVQHGSDSPVKSQPLLSTAMGQSGGSGYPQLPTARILPQALPTASVVGSGSSSPRTGTRVPIDDVVDKVTNMGFSRDQVRATVRRLTENGQSVDLNVVLDKLMNNGECRPPQGWYGR
nr:proline-rich protein 36-like isoform X2 [Nicotiana tomentosiformis]